MTFRIRLDHVDAACTAVPYELRQQKAHRARPIDEVLRRDLGVDHVQAMHRAGQGLHQRAPGPGDITRQAERVGGRDRHELGTGSVRRSHADRVPVLAEVEVAGPALPARAVEQGRVDRHEVAGLQVADAGPERDDLAGELVSRHDRVPRRGELPAQDVDVRPTDPAGVDLDDDLSRPGRRIIDLFDLQVVGCLDDDSFHLPSI